MTPTPATIARERVGALALSTIVATYGFALFLAATSTIHVGWFLAAIHLLLLVPLSSTVVGASFQEPYGKANLLRPIPCSLFLFAAGPFASSP